ncbi:response regulator [Luteimonas sp. SDU101]|uniref:response regulator n=1 Tax=Luteimonas sp. SDU101 TaxID=3422593 RepID=UPI003EB88DFD
MNPRILLVEDDPTSRAFLLAATEALPARVDTAASMADALALAGIHDYALWLIDANLPDGSGAALLARLRSCSLDTPALAHTASREPGDHQALRVAGFAGTLAKPLSAADWQAALRSALANRAEDPGSPAPRSHRVAEPDGMRSPPVWDDAQALAALAGDAGNVAAMRGLFLAELPATHAAVAAAARGGDASALRDLLHRLEAGCGFVGAVRLELALRQLRAAPDSAAALRAFEDAAQATLSGP